MNSVWEKLPVVILTLSLYETQQEEESKHISLYPIPYKKDWSFDVVELMKEVEKGVCVKWRKSNLSARVKAMLEFVLLISQANDVIDDHFKKLEMHGFNQENAWDIAAISAFFFALSICLAHFVNLVPNKE